MRVLHVTGGLGIGGSQRVVRVVSENMARSHDVSVLKLGGVSGSYEKSLIDAGVEVLSLRGHRLSPINVRVLIKVLTTRWDVIFSHLTVSSVVGGLLAGVSGARSYACFHGRIYSRFRRWVIRLSVGLHDEFVVVSKAVADHLATECGVPSESIKVIYNGVRPVELRRSSEVMLPELGELTVRDVLLCVGRFTPNKGQDVLLRSLPKISADHNVAVVFVGDGPFRTECEEIARELRCGSHIYFAGEQEDITPWYSIADIVVVPSIFEGFSLVTVEAMSASLPVVATYPGGPAEIIDDGVTGFLARSGSVEDLGRAVSRALDSDRGQVGAAGRATFERSFTEDRFVADYVGLLAEEDA